MFAVHRRGDVCAAASGKVHVDQHHIGQVRADEDDGRGDGRGFPDDVNRLPERGAHPRAQEGMVADQRDAWPAHRALFTAAASGE